MMLMPDFWNDQQGAQTIINEANGIKAIVNEYNDLLSTQENLEMTLELLKEEPDEDLQEELGIRIRTSSKRKWQTLNYKCYYLSHMIKIMQF